MVVSLLTKRPQAKQLDRFYGVLRTPVEPNEIIAKPFALPEGVSPALQRKIINHADWEIQRPSARSLAGFLLASIGVAALIGAVVLLVRIGA